jgi:hypothetical protein
MGLDFMYGTGTTSCINICMPKYLMPKAACKETGQSVASNDVVTKFKFTQRHDAQLEAERLAANMTTKTGRTWTGYVDAFAVLDPEGRNRL